MQHKKYDEMASGVESKLQAEPSLLAWRVLRVSDIIDRYGLQSLNTRFLPATSILIVAKTTVHGREIGAEVVINCCDELRAIDDILDHTRHDMAYSLAKRILQG